MNETILRFGYPATLVADYEHWVVLVRPSQPTLGSLVLASKSQATAFSGLDPAGFTQIGRVVADIEESLSGAIGYSKINYLMLMMVDPHVHFHVIPRYEGERSACGLTIADAGWPKTPALAEALGLGPGQIVALASWIKGYWPKRR